MHLDSSQDFRALGEMLGKAVRATRNIHVQKAAIDRVVSLLGTERAERVLATALEAGKICFPSGIIIGLEWCKQRLKHIPDDEKAAHDLGLFKAVCLSKLSKGSVLTHEQIEQLLIHPTSFNKKQQAEYYGGLFDGAIDKLARARFWIAFQQTWLQIEPDNESTAKQLKEAQAKFNSIQARIVRSTTRGLFKAFFEKAERIDATIKSTSPDVPH